MTTLSLCLFVLACRTFHPGDDSGLEDHHTTDSAASSTDDSALDALDADDDGYAATEDCDDDDPAIHPGVDETCNGADDDCDGDTDEGVLSEFWVDGDGDGYGSTDVAQACEPGSGLVSNDDDCDDTDAAVHVDCVPPLLDVELADAEGFFWGDTCEYAAEVIATGDLDGDGKDDVVMGSAQSFGNDGYVVFGPAAGASSLQAAGIAIHSPSDTFSIDVDDVDGDGRPDLGWGAPYDAFAGVYVVYGPVTTGIDLSTDSDVLLAGREETASGISHAFGDLDGDGIADAVVGNTTDELVYVEYGPLSGSVSLKSEADATLTGWVDASTGRRVRAGGDVDGDGIGDLLIAAVYHDMGAASGGVVYVVPGPVTGDHYLWDIATGTLVGTEDYANAGQGLGMGDVDGDGTADAVVIAKYAKVRTFVVLAAASGTQELASADIVLEYGSADWGPGIEVGDQDHDGVAELLLGATSEDSSAGTAYLVSSPPTGTSAIWDVATAAFHGENPGDKAGESVAFGDVDGDGTGEVIVGAPEYSPHCIDGAVYVDYAD